MASPRDPEIAIFMLLGYVWAGFHTLIGLLLAMIYRAHDFQWSDGCLEAIGGTFRRDGHEITRIWGRPGAQTHGWLILYASDGQRLDRPLRVHERVHVLHGMIGGPLYMIAYGLHFLFEFARGGFRPSRWHDAYLRVWSERIARRVARQYRHGFRPDAWGG